MYIFIQYDCTARSALYDYIIIVPLSLNLTPKVTELELREGEKDIAVIKTTHTLFAVLFFVNFL